MEVSDHKIYEPSEEKEIKKKSKKILESEDEKPVKKSRRLKKTKHEDSDDSEV